MQKHYPVTNTDVLKKQTKNFKYHKKIYHWKKNPEYWGVRE